jgi:hypothetical protein
MSAADHNVKAPSIFSQKFNISSFDSDPLRWNKEWDKVLQTVSATDVYDTFSPIFKHENGGSELIREMEKLKDRTCKFQELLVKVWVYLEEKGHFVTAWLLLEEKDRLTHMLKGLAEACQTCFCAQDSRALCPEIRTSCMQKEKGKAFVDFIRAYCGAKKDVGEKNMYRLPSEWLEKAADASTLPPQEIKFMFQFLTIQRNEFICESINAFYVLSSSSSLLRSLKILPSEIPPVHHNVSRTRLVRRRR